MGVADRQDRRDAYLIASIVVLGAALRFATLGVQSFWDDEGWTYALVHKSFGGLIRAIPATESSPPLYYVLIWIWSHAVGTSEFGLRSFSAIFGTATIWVAFRCCSVLFTRRAALIAAGLAATSPLLVWYSQEARCYALSAFLDAVGFLFFVRALRRSETRALTWWAMASVLAMLTHYFAFFLVLPEAIWLLFRFPSRKAALVASACTGAVGAALLPLAIHQSRKDFALFSDLPLSTRVAQVLEQLVTGFGVWSYPLGRLAAGAAAALLAAAAVLLLTRTNAGKHRYAVVVTASVVALAAAIPVSLAIGGRDYVATTYFIGLLIPAAVLIAYGFSLSRAGTAATACLMTLFLAVNIAVATNHQLQRLDYRGAANALGPAIQDRLIVMSPASAALQAYLPGLRAIVIPQSTAPAYLRHVLAPKHGIRVSEIDIIGMAEKSPGRRFITPRRLARATPAKGFSQFGRITGDVYTVVRFRATEAQRVSAQALWNSRLNNSPRVDVLFQPAETASDSR